MKHQTQTGIINIPERLSGYLLKNIEIIELEGLTRELFEPENVIGLTKPIEKKELIYYAARNKLWHIIRRDSVCFIDEILLSLTMLDKTVDIKANGLFENMRQRPFDLYNFQNSAKISFNKKADWCKILNAYEIFSASLPQNNIVKNTIPFILDEYFTNAIYNAPLGIEKDWDKHRLNPKRKNFVLKEEGAVYLAYGDKYIFIECVDPYGTFNPPDMLKCIKKTYDLGIGNAMRDDFNCGAGIGLRLVWEKSTSMGVIVEKNSFCSFFCIIPYKIPEKELNNYPKNFHIVSR